MLEFAAFEENIGKIWDKFLRRSDKLYEKESVFFTNISKSLTIFYHLLGGQKSKKLQITDKRFISTASSLFGRVFTSNRAFFLPWQDDDGIYLPSLLAFFPSKHDNEMLYFWLVAMAVKVNMFKGNLLYKNFLASRILINLYPGFKFFYQRASRYLIEKNDQFLFINFLEEKNLTNKQYLQTLDNHPFPMWIYPPIYFKKKYSNFDDENDLITGNNKKPQKQDILEMKKKASRIDDKKKTDGLLAFLPDSIMSMMEQINVDRSEDDTFDKDALYNAQDLNEITLGRKKANLSARLKMDLALEVDTKEEYPIGKGHLLDEWDYSKKRYLKNYVLVKPFLTTNIEPISLPIRLQRVVKRIKDELSLMKLDYQKNSHLTYGNEIDLDTWIDFKVEKNRSNHHQKFYVNIEKKIRDMSTLILADVSLSTEAGITQEIRIIDMIKDALMVFAESLQILQDKFAIYTFSSLRNKNVRFEIIKNFNEKYTKNSRGRISAIKPGYYTRLGAAIRESTNILKKQQSKNKLLLIISDGKPNDLDKYDGRYGIEDTKKAILESRQLGFTTFCITIDLQSKEYLPYLFGKNGYMVIANSKKLPIILSEIYMNLTK